MSILASPMAVHTELSVLSRLQKSVRAIGSLPVSMLSFFTSEGQRVVFWVVHSCAKRGLVSSSVIRQT